MKQPTEQEKKQLLEWCGFTLRCPPEKDAYGRGIWNYPNGLYGDVELDLNILFKYAVPNKAIKTVCLCDHFDYSEGMPKRNGYEATVMWDRMNNVTQGIDKDPALALFWAIKQIIDGLAETES